jgi:hypothetical protein
MGKMPHLIVVLELGGRRKNGSRVL